MSEENKLFYLNDQPEAHKAHSVKLINFDNGQLSLSQDGGNLLKNMDAKKQANLLFVFGNARSGKSFLMNCLVGKPGVFKVINSSQPCTKGVDISSYFSTYNALSSSAVLPDAEMPTSAGNPLVGFVDVEGQGAEDNTYDTMLALPLLMTSKIILFNHKGAPTVSDMLSRLGVLARAADYVDLNDAKQPEVAESEEESDNDEKEEAVGQKKKKGAKFGHLHVVFRDFSFEGDSDDVYEQLMGKEKIVKKAKAVGAKANDPNDPARAAKERNDIRQMLLDNFASISVWLLKQPATADDLRDNKELPSHLIDPEFSATVREMMTTVAKQLAEPTLFNNQPLTGPRLHQLISQVIKVLNEGGSINVPSVYRAMEKETLGKVAAECLAQFEKVLIKIRKELPQPVAKLKKSIEDARAAMFQMFDDELAGCPLEAELKQKKDEMNLIADRQVDEVYRENELATNKRMVEVVERQMIDMRAVFDDYCEKNLPQEDSQQIARVFEHLKNETIKNVKQELASLPDIPASELQGLLLKHEANLKEYLTFVMVKNESMIKDQRIQKMQKEALDMQNKLAEQNRQLQQYLEEEKKKAAEMQGKLRNLEETTEAQNRKVQAAKEEEEKLKQYLASKDAELEVLRKKKKCVIL